MVESCSLILGALAPQRLATIAARFLKELCEVTVAGKVPRLKSDLPTPRQEIFQICRGMRHVKLSLRTNFEVTLPSFCQHLTGAVVKPLSQSSHRRNMSESYVNTCRSGKRTS